MRVKQLRAVRYLLGAALSAATLAGGVPAAEGSSTIRITRRAEIPRQPGIGGTEYTADIVLRVDGEQLAGEGQVSLRIISGEGPWEYKGSVQVRVEGTLKDDRVSAAIVGPAEITLVETRGGTIAVPFNATPAYQRFDGMLHNGKFEATESVPTASGVPLRVTTLMEGGLSIMGQLEVKAEHAIIPGHLAYFNKVSFRLVDSPEIRSALAGRKGGVEATAEVATLGPGRLRKNVEEAGAREQTISGLAPGRWYDLYYSWNGDSPAPTHKERIRVSVPALEIEGEAGFEVGIDFEVVSVERMMKRPPEISRPELFRIRIKDALHPDKDAAALAQELGLRPELSLVQTGYRATTTLDDLVTGFAIESSGVAEIIAAAMTGKGKALIQGHKLTWNVGRDGVLAGSGTGDLGYPHITFQQRGLFLFDVDITGIAYAPYGGGVMHEPDSPAKAVTIAVTELDADTQFLVEVLVPCMEGLISAAKEAATADQLEGWKALWECLRSGLGSDLAQQALADHVLINAVAIWISDLIDGGLAITDAAGEALKPQTAEEMQEQVIEQFQAIAEEMSDALVAAVSKDGLTSQTADSDRAGRLSRGPEHIKLSGFRAKSAKERARAALDYAPQKRIQEGKSHVIVPASKGEILTLDLVGDGKPGEAIVISKSQATRLKYPAGAWQSRIAIAPDGSVRTLSGTKLEATSSPARKAAKRRADVEGDRIAQNGSAGAGIPQGSGLWQSIKEKARQDRGAEVGGGCTYLELPGNATITRVAKTAASSHQASVEGAPGYDGYEIRFKFTPEAPIGDPSASAWAARSHEIRLTNSWYPGPRIVEKYGLVEGRAIRARLKVIRQGACTPHPFALPSVDTADYFETAR